MTRNPPDGVTAAELMAELERDPEFQRAAAEREAKRLEQSRKWQEAEQPIIGDLHRAGVEVTSVWDLVNSSDPYPAALPVLIEHLERRGYPDRVLEGVARALAVKPAGAYWTRLRDLYLRASGPDEMTGLAVALAAAASPENLGDLLTLLNETSRGDSRIFFVGAVLRIGNERGRRAVEALKDDPVLGKEATALLSRRRR